MSRAVVEFSRPVRVCQVLENLTFGFEDPKKKKKKKENKHKLWKKVSIKLLRLWFFESVYIFIYSIYFLYDARKWTCLSRETLIKLFWGVTLTILIRIKKNFLLLSSLHQH